MRRLAIACIGTALVAEPALGGLLIAVDVGGNLYRINRHTGRKVFIGEVSANAGITAGLAYDRSTDTIYLSSSNLDSLFTLDLATGEATLVGEYGDVNFMHGIEFHDGMRRLFGADSGTNSTFFDIDTKTGFATAIGPTGFDWYVQLAYNSDNGVMYATHGTPEVPGDDGFYQVDVVTGEFSFIGPLGDEVTNPTALAYAWDRGILYMVDNYE